VEHGQWRPVGANEKLGELPHEARVRHIDGGQDGFVESVVERVGDDPNHLQPAGCVSNSNELSRIHGRNLKVGQMNPAANSVALGEVLTR